MVVKKEKAAKYADVLEKFHKCLTEASSLWGDIHAQYTEDKRFILKNEVFTQKEKKDRKGKPLLEIPKMTKFVMQVINDMRQNNIGIRVLPVDNGADVEKAKVRQGIVRGVERENKAKFAYSYAGADAVVGGVGAYRILTEYANPMSFDQRIKITRVLDFTSILPGPTVEPDYSDMMYCIVTNKKASGKPLTAEQEKNLKSKKKTDVWGTLDIPHEYEFWVKEETDDTLYVFKNGRTVLASSLKKDASDDLFKLDAKGNRVSRPTKKCAVKCYKLFGGEVVEETDWLGKWIPIVIINGREVWVDGKRELQGLGRHSKDAAKMYNYARTAQAERIGQAPKNPWVGAEESISDKWLPHWMSANTEPKSILLYKAHDLKGNPLPPPQRPNPVMVDPALTQETIITSQELEESTGIFKANLGAPSNETSGKAIMARAREGDTATFDFMENQAIGIGHGGRIINDLIPKIYDTERQIRIVGEDETEKVIKVNAAEKDADGNTYSLSSDEEYDLAVDVGASYTTKRIENAENILELMRVSPVAATALPNLYVRSLDFNFAEEASKQIERAMPPGIVQPKEGEQPPMPPQAIQAIQQAEQLQAAVSELTKELEAEKASKSVEMAKLGLERQKIALDGERLKIDMFSAQTARMAIGMQAKTKLTEAGIKSETDLTKTQMQGEARLAEAALSAATTAQAGLNGSTGTLEPGNDTEDSDG